MKPVWQYVHRRFCICGHPGGTGEVESWRSFQILNMEIRWIERTAGSAVQNLAVYKQCWHFTYSKSYRSLSSRCVEFFVASEFRTRDSNWVHRTLRSVMGTLVRVLAAHGCMIINLSSPLTVILECGLKLNGQPPCSYSMCLRWFQRVVNLATWPLNFRNTSTPEIDSDERALSLIVMSSVRNRIGNSWRFSRHLAVVVIDDRRRVGLSASRSAAWTHAYYILDSVVSSTAFHAHRENHQHRRRI